MTSVKKQNPFQKFLGIKLDNINADGCSVSLDLKRQHFNLYGIPHGGIHSTILDIAMGIAGSYSEDKKITINTITLNLNVNFIMEAQTKKILGTGHITRRTHRLAFCEGVVTDLKGNKLATSSGVFKLIRK